MSDLSKWSGKLCLCGLSLRPTKRPTDGPAAESGNDHNTLASHVRDSGGGGGVNGNARESGIEDLRYVLQDG